jgi:hypothetical protein
MRLPFAAVHESESGTDPTHPNVRYTAAVEG